MIKNILIAVFITGVLSTSTFAQTTDCTCSKQNTQQTEARKLSYSEARVALFSKYEKGVDYRIDISWFSHHTLIVSNPKLLEGIKEFESVYGKLYVGNLDTIIVSRVS